MPNNENIEIVIVADININVLNFGTHNTTDQYPGKYFTSIIHTTNYERRKT